MGFSCGCVANEDLPGDFGDNEVFFAGEFGAVGAGVGACGSGPEMARL